VRGGGGPRLPPDQAAGIRVSQKGHYSNHRRQAKQGSTLVEALLKRFDALSAAADALLGSVPTDGFHPKQ
jgi:hypothetical protein